jgi:hypothetical protein
MFGKRSLSIAVTFFLVTAATPATAQGRAPGCKITITEPHRSGQVVAMRWNVKGFATLPAGLHLWVFARPVKMFKTPLNQWFIQTAPQIDPTTHAWKADVGFGGPSEANEPFEVHAAAFAQPEHNLLMAELKEHNRVKSWDAIDLPTEGCAGPVVEVTRQ